MIGNGDARSAAAKRKFYCETQILYIRMRNAGGKMRKAVSLILIMVICLGYVSAANAEVTFRGIPWESSIEESLELLASGSGNEIEMDTPFFHEVSWNGSIFWVFQNSTFSTYAERKIPTPLIEYYTLSYRYKPEKILVAGYPIDSISLFFIPEYNVSENSISQSSGRLVQAAYKFDFYTKYDQAKMVYQEICGKLDGLYGAHTVEESRTVSHKSSYTGNRVYDSIYRWEMGDVCIESVPYYYNGTLMNGFFITYSYYPDDIKADVINIAQIIQNQYNIEQMEAQQQMEQRGTDGL